MVLKINSRVTRSLSRLLVQRYLTAELCSLSSLFVSLERAFSDSSIEILLYYTQYAFNWNFSKPRKRKKRKLIATKKKLETTSAANERAYSSDSWKAKRKKEDGKKREREMYIKQLSVPVN